MWPNPVTDKTNVMALFFHFQNFLFSSLFFFFCLLLFSLSLSPLETYQSHQSRPDTYSFYLIMLRLQKNQSRLLVQAALRRAGRPSVSAFHTSRMANNEKKSEQKQEQQQQQNSPDPDKSPFQVFVETFKTEWKKSDELQNNIKALADETGRMAESGAYKRAKDAWHSCLRHLGFQGC